MDEESWEDLRPAIADAPLRGRLLHLHTKCIASTWCWTTSLPCRAVFTPLRIKIYRRSLHLRNLACARVYNPQYLMARSVKALRSFMRHGGSEKLVDASRPPPQSQGGTWEVFPGATRVVRQQKILRNLGLHSVLGTFRLLNTPEL